MVRPGDIVGRSYRLTERIGQGELGEVWRAQHEKMGRDVAIKLLQPAWSVSATSVSAFLRDASASGRLQHPNLIELLDQGEHEGAPFVVMPLLRAEKLETFIERRGPIAMGPALRILNDLAQGVAAAHEQRAFHLRIEAANVLLHRDPRGRIVPKLIDFGIARLVGDRGSLSEQLSPIGYLAPEQRAGMAGDGRADVWALGMLLLHMLTGSLPLADQLEQLEASMPVAIDSVGREDPKVAALLRETLVHDRSKRQPARTFARRVRDLAARHPDDLMDLACALSIPESLPPDVLQTVSPTAALRAPSLPRFAAPRVPVIARVVTTRANTGRRRSRRLQSLVLPPPAEAQEPETDDRP